MLSSTNLSKLKLGERGTILSIDKKVNDLYYALIEMGFLPGTPIQLIRKSPLGDPLEYEIRGYRVSLRKSEAEKISIKNISH